MQQNKMTFDMNKKIFSRHTPLRAALLTLLMLMGAAGAKAQSSSESAGYVIYNGTYYCGGSSLTGIGTFDPTTCLWTAGGTNSGTLRNAAGYYLYRNQQNLSMQTSNSTSWTYGGTESGTTGRTIYNPGQRNTYYLYLNNTTWALTTTQGSAGNVLFAVTKNTYAASETAATISGPTTISNTDISAATYTIATDATYTDGYIDYVFRNASHLRNASDNANLTAVPTATTITSYTWSLSGISSDYAVINSSTGVVNYKSYVSSDQAATVTLTASQGGHTIVTTYSVTFEAPKTDPSSISVTSPMTVYVGQTGSVSYTLTPSPCYTNVTYSSADTGIATVNSSGEVTGVATGSTTITVTALKLDGTTTSALTGTVSVTVKNKVETPTITYTPTAADAGATATAEITCSTSGIKIYYTTDGTDPTSSSTEYTATFTVNDGDEVRAIAIKDPADALWDDSDIASQTYTACTTADPVISYSTSGSTATVTITAETGATIYYTTDGNDPTTSSSSGTTPVTISSVSSGTTIKAFAKNGSCQTSSVVSREIITSGTSGGIVTLYDLEDHTWTYYSGVDSSVDGGNYNTNYEGKLYSPNPRNVKITYKANGGAVSIDESETEFVYYKTLEESSTSGEYAYTVISNPFSKRPSGQGFGGWKITSGADYIKGHSANDVLDLDEDIVFNNLPYTSTNCISAEIELTATWVTLNNKTYASGNTITYSVTGGTYETNILVLNRNVTGTITATSPVTIMMVEPDGSSDYRGTYSFTGNITPNNDEVTKIEYSRWTTTGNIDATGRDFTIGRGIVRPSGGGTLYGTNTNRNINQTFKVESGIYEAFYAIGGTGPQNNMTKQHIILGNDYDRAKSDNDNLTITNNMMLLNRAAAIGTDRLIVTTKSGKFTTELDHSTAQASANCFYLWNNNSTNGSTGVRTLIIEGGEFWHIAGGVDYANSNDEVNLKIRMKGGTVHGSIYGGAARYDAHGGKQFVFTGGTVEGWIAGGSNGFLSEGSGNDNGSTQGNSYVYVGGTTQVNSGGSTTAINVSLGGNVYGAGCGNEGVSVSGRVTLGTNVVVADESFVERGVYGGGAYGGSPATANVYITGNAHVGGVADATFNVQGGVYGGARAKGGGSTNIYMTGGLVETGLYGGSNRTGTLTGSVTMQINGGQVGTDSKTANIHGGGYGTATEVDGNVDLTLGVQDQTTPGVTVYGDVYGGSADGSVNDATSDHTNVTLNAGTIYGSLYGGGLGITNADCNVNGAVAVVVNGGAVKKQASGDNPASIFGCNNAMGSPKSTVTVTVNASDPSVTTVPTVYYKAGDELPAGKSIGDVKTEGVYAINGVYGGGNKAHYNPTTIGQYPTVTINGCETSIKDVYGGGNAAAVPYTSVTVNGGIIGRVFAGGNGESGTPAHVGYMNTNENPTANSYGAGTASATIKGGTIGQVFGGSNAHGVIRVSSSISIDKSTASGACPMIIGEVYRGGNEAPGALATISIGCTGDVVDGDEGHAAHPENIGTTLEGIGELYGGSRKADNTGEVNLNITSGIIRRVFGGNNISGTVNGTVTVSVQQDETKGCGWYVGDVFGGGNLATYSGDPVVKILHGTVSGNVYGGGAGNLVDGSMRGVAGTVTGNPKVTIGDDNASHTAIVLGDVYGGGDAADVSGTPVIVVNDCSTQVGNLYGGGNAADVTATSITVNGGTIGDAFGGGHGDKSATNPSKYADVKGDVTFNVNGGTIARVFAGSNSRGTIMGTSNLTINKSTSCEMKIREVYGGGNEADGVASNINIGCTGDLTTQASDPENIGVTLEGIGYVYGGANQANIGTSSTPSDIVVNINSGIVGNVFGGNNTSGDIYGTITVNIEKDDAATCASNWYVGNVFGGGNLAQYTGSPAVNIKNGTVSLNVYGGGKGDPSDQDKGQVTGNPVVTVGDTEHAAYAATIEGYVFGGGDAAEIVGNTLITYHKDNNTAAKLFGGGNAAGVSGTTTVNMSAGNITEGLYGGCNSQGSVTGTATVNVTGGQVGTDAVHANVHGGGYGADTETAGDVVVNIGSIDEGGVTSGTAVIYGDVYGGSALGKVNSGLEDYTRVNLNKGTIHGDAYGGGLGQLADNTTNPATPAIEALVKGNVVVTQNGVAFVSATTTVDEKDIVTAGRIFGCNNLNGTPQGKVLVLVKKTVASDGTAHAAGVIDMKAVYGGGNLAAYNPVAATLSAASEYTYTNKNSESATYTVNNSPLLVVIDGCDDIGIEYVYGGGNAAATPSTAVLVLGADIIGNVFGGGNGKDKITKNNGTSWQENPGADVGILDMTAYTADNANGTYGTGIATTTVLGGTITNVFGGSNAKGVIRGSMSVDAHSDSSCPLNVDNLFGGGNEADSGPGVITIGCMEAGNKIDAVYGGANKANIDGDVILNIIGGNIGKVFGGNNLEGSITGKIIVNINRQDESCGWNVDYVYGGGNLAPYTAPAATPDYPEVNIINGTVNYAVFGGGLGSTAIVTGNPRVNINPEYTDPVTGTTFQGTTTVAADGTVTKADVVIGHTETVAGETKTYGDVYGGGDEANVEGNTLVNITGGHILNKVYGAGKGLDEAGKEMVAHVSGNTTVIVSAGQIDRNVYGGGEMASIGDADEAKDDSKVNITTDSLTTNPFSYATGLARVIITGTASLGTDANCVGDYGGGCVYGSGYGKAGSIYSSFAYVKNTLVTIAGQAKVRGSVFGSGENGHVRKDTKVYVKGDCYIGTELTEAEHNIDSNGRGKLIYRGNVYGGGRGIDHQSGTQYYSLTAGRVDGNTYVEVSGGHIYHDVFGGGSLATVGMANTDPVTGEVTYSGESGKSEVHIKGGVIGYSATNPSRQGFNCGFVYGGCRGLAAPPSSDAVKMAYVHNAYVYIEPGADIKGSVFGGGANGHVKGDTYVEISGGSIGTALLTDEVGFDDLGVAKAGVFRGNAYAGGRGVDMYEEEGSEEYSLTAGAVYGNATLLMTGGHVWHNVYGSGAMASVGTVTAKPAGTHVHDEIVDGSGNTINDESGEVNYLSGVFTDETGTVRVTITGGTVGDTTPGHEGRNNGRVYGAGRGVSAARGDRVASMEYVKETFVTIGTEDQQPGSYSGSEAGELNYPYIYGAVFGGGENGHVKNDTHVDIRSGIIGWPLDEGEGGKHKTTTDGASKNPYRGHVFGGGRGVDPLYHESTETRSSTAGRVYGHTNVTMTGGLVRRAIYGGGLLASVGVYQLASSDLHIINEIEDEVNAGNATINISGGIIGNVNPDGTVITDASTSGYPLLAPGDNNGHVFGSSCGMVADNHEESGVAINLQYRQMGYSHSTLVNISGGHLFGSVFGSGENGHVWEDSRLNISGGEIGSETSTLIYSGNVYGSGRGVDHPHEHISETAGKVRGNTTVYVTGGIVWRDVYGGGSLASVGEADETAEEGKKNVTADLTTNNPFPYSSGLTRVIIDGESQVHGSVYGSGRGVASTKSEYRQAAYVKNTLVTVTGNAHVWKNVFGGGNAGHVRRNTQVDIDGSAKVDGNVYGGGAGSIESPTAGLVNHDVLVNIKNGLIAGDVYGGGAIANTNTHDKRNDPTLYPDKASTYGKPEEEEYAKTEVNLLGGIILGDAYGGGQGVIPAADATPEEEANAGALVRGDVTVILNGTAFRLATVTDDEGNVVPTSGRVFGCNNLNGSPEGTVLVKVLQTKGLTESGGTYTINDTKPTKDSGVYELQAVYGGGNLAAYDPWDANATGPYTENGHSAVGRPLQVVIDGCDEVSIDYVYGGGNAAATPSTDAIIVGAYEIGTVFAGGNGKDRITYDKGVNWDANPGADVGYKPNGGGEYGQGTALASLFGGTIHNAFGGSNTLGNIRGEGKVAINELKDGEGNPLCPLVLEEVYGGGNEAYMAGGAAIDLGCVSKLNAVYGGAKNADVGSDIELTITSGHFGRVFGGNNIGGKISGSITVNIEETGCNPITIGELYGCGNQAAYSIYGYEQQEVGGETVWVTKKTGDNPKNNPTLNIRSFTSIGRIFGGGLGEKAEVVGSPTVNINEIVGEHASPTSPWAYNGATVEYYDDASQPTTVTSSVILPTHEAGKIGAVGTVYGGGNAAPVYGDTHVHIGTDPTVTLTSKAAGDPDKTQNTEGVDIRNNVFGGGLGATAIVSGNTDVTIGQ